MIETRELEIERMEVDAEMNSEKDRCHYIAIFPLIYRQFNHSFSRTLQYLPLQFDGIGFFT